MKKIIICGAILVTLMLVSLSSVSAVEEKSIGSSIVERIQLMKKSLTGPVNPFGILFQMIIDFFYTLIHGSGPPTEGGGHPGPGGP